MTKPVRLRGDFNGLFGDILCLSHDDTCTDDTGAEVPLAAGMFVLVFDIEHNDLGERDDLVASGLVEPAPDWLSCKGSKWVLRIDAQGVGSESDRALE